MKIVTFTQSLPIEHPESLVDAIAPDPTPGPRDLLVEVRAISVNPVDTKVRRGGGPGAPTGGQRILGWDAAGVVRAVGREVTAFRAGDEVYYAGALDRSGCYAELQVVDDRIVGPKPKTLDFPEAAALPLTTLTAWELLFDRMRVPTAPGSTGAVLIVGAAGGVGSIATQLARRLTSLLVIGTASRPETQAWVKEMGAHHVLDHRKPLAAQVKAIVPGGVSHALALTKTEAYFDELVVALAPQGALGLIDDPKAPLDIVKLKPKCLSLHWEFMFARARFETPDMAEQGRILTDVARLVDAGTLRTTMKTNVGPIDAATLKRAHALVESGTAIGKVVLAGF